MSASLMPGSSSTWEIELSALKERLSPVFGRRELRETGTAFIDGLLSGVERKTGWLMAEVAGLERPYRMQSLLGRSSWSAEALRDCVRAYAIEALGDVDGVLVIGETGFVKKGDRSVGVARQYPGISGQIENCQVGVFLAYTSRFGHALIDRRLYLPQLWTTDKDRRTKARVPDDIGFVPKIEIARDMIAAALDEQTPCRWVLADPPYGGGYRLRRMLEERRQPYVLAVRSSQDLRFLVDEGSIGTDPKTLADDLQEQDWMTFVTAADVTGRSDYDWARIVLSQTVDVGFEHWLMIRRNRKEREKYMYYLAFLPRSTTLVEPINLTGLRWTIDDLFERAKSRLGLDHCEARSWHGWHRHVTLVMAAQAFLAKLCAAEKRITCHRGSSDEPNETRSLVSSIS